MRNRSLFLLFGLLTFIQCSKDSSDDLIPPVIVDPVEPPPTPSNQPIPVITFTTVPCANGFAGEYPCSNYDLINRVALSTFGSSEANDNWGWKDPETNKEYMYCKV